MGGRSRHWVWTLPNYTEEHRTIIGTTAAAASEYVCYQPEISPTTGTPHLQGFISFANPRLFNGVKRLFAPATPHLEPARGTVSQACDYCQKEETRDTNASFGFTEFGTRPSGPGQGSRTDLDAIGARLREGESLVAIAEEFPGDFIRYGRGFAEYQVLFQPRRNFKTEVRWFYGSTGTGKSHAAREEAGVDAYWKNMDSSKWWDSYSGKEAVVLDDYRCNFCTFSFLLRLFDEYPLQLEMKGSKGGVQFASKLIIVTAPQRPEKMWQSRSTEDMNQLLRRITEIRLFGDEPLDNPLVEGFEPGN